MKGRGGLWHTNVSNDRKIAKNIHQMLLKYSATQAYRMVSQKNSVVSMVLVAAVWTALKIALESLDFPRERRKIMLEGARGRHLMSIAKVK